MKSLYAIHGLESHGDWFSPLARELAAHDVELVAIERVPRDRARSPEAWLDAMALPAGAAVLAHSWGAKLAAYAVQQGRLRPSSLVIVNPGLRPQADIANPRSWELDGDCVRIPIEDERYSADPDVARFIATDDRRLRFVTRSFLAADRKMTRAVSRGAAISVPTLVMTSGRDRIIDEEATEKELARLFLRRDSIRFDECGHLLILEAPRALATAIGAWLGKQ